MEFKELKELLKGKFEDLEQFHNFLDEAQYMSDDDIMDEFEIDKKVLGNFKVVYETAQYDDAPYQQVIHFEDFGYFAELKGYYHSYSGVSFYHDWDAFNTVIAEEKIITVYNQPKDDGVQGN